ncbi:hypothetical protein MIR68_010850 [Amoeboaphelidium protococcarum]|nr:hypothetical protein MIR68_010850 [Amoeboaphelidium protococcarum]
MSSYVRSLVSKKKKRFNEDGFDLDLTYITDNIIAMGYPAENVEGMYRNNMSDVVRFLDLKHKNKYKVYNLCSERTYDKSKFHNRVAHYPFADHNAPPMELIKPFCVDIHNWLQADSENVAVVHCKAGKGRTGVMICAYLLYSGMQKHAKDALQFYGAARTSNSKGVTIPSQLRYVSYFEKIIKDGIDYLPQTVFLISIRLSPMPKFSSPAVYANIKDLGAVTFNPVFTLTIGSTKIYSSSKASVISKQGDTFTISVGKPIPLCGDVKVDFYHKSSMQKEKTFHFWFNTSFIQDGRHLLLTKSEIDKANKDKLHKIYDQNFKLELEFADTESIHKQQLPNVPPRTSSKSDIVASSGSSSNGGGNISSRQRPSGSAAQLARTHNDSQTSLDVVASDRATDDPFEYDAGDLEEESSQASGKHSQSPDGKSSSLRVEQQQDGNGGDIQVAVDGDMDDNLDMGMTVATVATVESDTVIESREI